MYRITQSCSLAPMASQALCKIALCSSCMLHFGELYARTRRSALSNRERRHTDIHMSTPNTEHRSQCAVPISCTLRRSWLGGCQ